MPVDPPDVCITSTNRASAFFSPFFCSFATSKPGAAGSRPKMRRYFLKMLIRRSTTAQSIRLLWHIDSCSILTRYTADFSRLHQGPAHAGDVGTETVPDQVYVLRFDDAEVHDIVQHLGQSSTYFWRHQYR